MFYIELIFIAILAFIILGPAEFPKIMYQLARMIRKVQQWSEKVAEEIDLDRLEKQSFEEEIFANHAEKKDLHVIEDYEENATFIIAEKKNCKKQTRIANDDYLYEDEPDF